MRCLACNKLLSPEEDARKYRESGQRVQLCDRDAAYVDVPMVEGNDIKTTEGSEDDALSDQELGVDFVPLSELFDGYEEPDDEM